MKKTENQKPHHVLWDFINGGFDEKSERRLNQPNLFLEEKPKPILNAFGSSPRICRWKQQKNIDPMHTTDSRVVSYPENFSEETTFGAVGGKNPSENEPLGYDEEGNPTEKTKTGKRFLKWNGCPCLH